MLRLLGSASLLCVASIGLINFALAQGTASVPSASTLTDPAAMERDRQRSKGLSPADRERAVAVFDQAFALYQAGEFDAAGIGFERGLRIDPGNGKANFYLGDILARLGDVDRARARYERATFFDADSAEGLKACRGTPETTGI